MLTSLLITALGYGGLALYLHGARPGADRGIGALTIAAAVSLLLSWLLAVRFSRGLERSLHHLAGTVRQVGGGNLAERVSTDAAVRLPGELAELVSALNWMGDATERLVRQIQSERAQLYAMLERSADGVLAVDAQGRLRFLNTAGRRILELHDDAVTEAIGQGRTFMAVTRNHELDSVLRRCRMEGLQKTQVLQLGRQRRDVDVIFLPLDGAGEWRYLGLLHDLTEVRRAEGQRRDFVSNVSHELRTPLASIRAAVEALLEGAIDEPDTGREFLDAVNREVDRLWQLVEELLELGRIESGETPFQFGAIPAGELLEEAVQRMNPLAERAGVALSWQIEAGMPPIRADRERLVRSLINLVHNAIKFTASGGSVSLWAGAQGAEAEICVSDTGSGIPAAEIDRIFERFYKVDRARTSSGTGLGLAIVKHTLQAHNGRIEVESEAGAGSTFRLFLPWADGSPHETLLARRGPR